MSMPPLLTTKIACKVVGYDPDRLNEQVSLGNFACAPKTSPGRTRLFDPHAMLALKLFVDQMDNGVSASVAGVIACEVATEARVNPECPAISYVLDYFTHPSGYACTYDQVPAPETWFGAGDDDIARHDVRQVITFNVAKARSIIAHYTEYERSIIGSED